MSGEGTQLTKAQGQGKLYLADEPTLALLPRGELHVIRGDERKVSWERPEEYAETLLRFVERG